MAGRKPVRPTAISLSQKTGGLELDSDMRTAAYVHALTRLGEAVASKGTRTYFANGAR
jgi:hypothetical protein